MQFQKYFFAVFLLVYATLSMSLNNKNNKSVNLLSFWGYLDDPKIKTSIESKCNVKFSNDTYYTNEELLDIFNKKSDNYDVIIFSSLAYGSIKNKITDNKSNLWKVSYNYYPYFKDYYLSHKYPHNVVFFTHALMGFMYNPNKININQNIYEIFRNAKNNDVIMADDPAEINNLLRLGFKISHTGTGRCIDNVYIERFWRSIKYERVNLSEFRTIDELENIINKYILYYNNERPHRALDGKTPNMIYNHKIIS